MSVMEYRRLNIMSGDGLVNPTKDDDDDDEYFTGAPRPLTVEVR